MNPRRFLQLCGTLLVVIGIVGFLRPNLAGDFLHFDASENWARVLLGMAMILVGPFPRTRRWAAGLVGVVALAVAVMGFLAAEQPSPNFLGVANLEHPVDNVLHLIIAVWGIVSAIFNRQTPVAL